jgi:hypothetical protein
MYLARHGLDKLLDGRPTILYHGTTREFRKFDLASSRKELVNKFYGDGIFLTPSMGVAVQYAEANRNIGFDKGIISDLKKIDRVGGAFLAELCKSGNAAWEGFSVENWNSELKLDPNTIADIAAYVIGSKVRPLGSRDDSFNIFSMSSGLPGYVYDELDISPSKCCTTFQS